MEESAETKLALLEQRQAFLESNLLLLQTQMMAMNTTLHNIDRQVSEARGGWKTILTALSLVGCVGAIAGFFAGNATST